MANDLPDDLDDFPPPDMRCPPQPALWADWDEHGETPLIRDDADERTYQPAEDLPPLKLAERLTLAEAAVHCGVTVATVKRWVKKGTLPTFAGKVQQQRSYTVTVSVRMVRTADLPAPKEERRAA